MSADGSDELERAIEAGLLVRPRQLEGESDIGYMLRRADENGLRTGAPLVAATGGHRFTRMGICPCCCAEQIRFWPDAWEDWSRPWCLLHRVWLFDTCTSCGSTFSASRLGFRFCACGAMLGEQGREQIGEDAWELALNRDQDLPMVSWLGAISLHGTAGKPGKRQARRSVGDVRQLIEAGARLLGDWPKTFLRRIDEIRLRPTAAERSAQLIADAFPGIGRALRRVPVNWRQRVADALDLYVGEARSSDQPLIGKNWFVVSRVPSAAEAARTLGVGFYRFKREVAACAEVLGSTRVTRGGRSRTVLSSDDVDMLQRRLHDAIGVKPAARRMGLAVGRVDELVRSGRLALTADGRLSKESVDRFMDRMLRGVQSAAACPEGFVSVAEAFRRWVPVRQTCELLQELHAGGVTCLSLGASTLGFRGLLLRRDDVAQWMRGAGAVKAWLTVPEVARRIAEKEQVVYGLVSCGMLVHQMRRDRGRLAARVDPNSVARFSERFASLIGLAKKAGVRSQDALGWAFECGLNVVTGPKIDGERKYFVEICE